MEIIGELESEILQAIEKSGEATAGDVTQMLQTRRDIAYTTVSTTLDRLHRKRLVNRRALKGPGGTKYLFSLASNERLRRRMVESAIDRLTTAFGDTAYSAIYRRLDDLSDDELEKLKKQVQKAKTSRKK